MKKSLALLMAASLTVLSLTACGGNGGTETTAATTAAQAEETTAAESESEVQESSDEAGEESETSGETAAAGDLQKLVIGASPAPHAEILNAAKDLMAAKGYELEIREYTDYIQPNNALDAGDLDANYFQHLPYLEQFIEQHGVNLASAGKVHYEPFGIYAGKTADLASLGDKAKVAVPNEVTNEARALLLLEAQGLIKLKEGAGLNATKNDIVENTKNLEIIEIEAAQIPRSINDVDIAVINGNYAIEAGMKVSDALAVEASDSVAATTYGNVVAVRAGEESSDAVVALMEVLKSDEIKKFMEEKYEGAVVPLSE
jgi:D-methionine transport system substrate-binding protein